MGPETELDVVAQSDYVSVVDLERGRLHFHPWSIGGGGAAELKDSLDGAGRTLESAIDHVGYTGQTNADDVLLAPRAAQDRFGGRLDLVRMVVIGEVLRDYGMDEADWSLFPYEDESIVPIDQEPAWLRRLWPYRTTMWALATFSKLTYRQEGRPWWEWHQVALHRLRTPLSIAFAFVATHNHFVLDRGGKVCTLAWFIGAQPFGVWAGPCSSST